MDSASLVQTMDPRFAQQSMDCLRAICGSTLCAAHADLSQAPQTKAEGGSRSEGLRYAWADDARELT